MTLFASLIRSSSLVPALLAAGLQPAVPAQRTPHDIGLPPRTANEQADKFAPRPLTEVQRFRRDLVEMQGSSPKVEARLTEMGIAYPAIEALIIEVARTALANEMRNLMVVARRFGTPRVGDELLFQLLARPLADATDVTVQTMAVLQGAKAREALKSCIYGRYAPVRRSATDVFVTMVAADDVPFALQLTSDQNLDLQLRGVDILRALGDERGVGRMLQMLSKDPALAAHTCKALIGMGMVAVPQLQALCGEPPIDRGWAYAVFALAQIEGATGRPLLDAAWVPQLTRRLRDPEALTRSLVAVALADLAYRSPAEQTFPDVDIAEALLEVAEPERFVPNLDMLRQPCEQRLLRLTGRMVATTEALRWRDWWQTQRAGFVGLRVDVEVTAATAGQVVVTLRRDQRVLRLLAEEFADLPPMAGAHEVLLAKSQMLELAKTLRTMGFGDVGLFRETAGLPAVRSLQVQVAGARAQVAVSVVENPAFEALAKLVMDSAESELWQVFRHPVDEPDRAAFWRAERRWRDEHPSELERAQRFARRVVTVWPVVPPALRARGVAFLLGHEQRQQLLTEADGARILTMLGSGIEIGDLELRLLELAAAVPGNKVWRDCIDFAAKLSAADNKAVRAVFAVLGTDAVLLALADERPAVRRAAIDEVVSARDQRAGARLVQLLADQDGGVQVKAAQAIGVLQVEAAADPLIELIVTEATPPMLRRESLRALGRVGGANAFRVLERALASPVQEDKEAALRGLGELRDARAAHLLAELAVIGHGKDLGALARYYLQRQGGVLAIPAIRHQLELVTNADLRTQLVLLLGVYQDPLVVPDLMDMLRDPHRGVEAAALLSGTTGIDVLSAKDRLGTVEAWWRQNRSLPQWRWLLDGLDATKEPTVLKPEQFALGSDPAVVEELARILVEVKEPRLAVLCGAVLRTLTGEDYGGLSLDATKEMRSGIAARYRLLAEASRAAQGR